MMDANRRKTKEEEKTSRERPPAVAWVAAVARLEPTAEQTKKNKVFFFSFPVHLS